jgi:uncharacterized repeat protein (TIGR03803 family)
MSFELGEFFKTERLGRAYLLCLIGIAAGCAGQGGAPSVPLNDQIAPLPPAKIVGASQADSLRRGPERIIHNFYSSINDGFQPWGLIVDKNGNFFGTTQQGRQSAACGTAFELKRSGSRYVESVLHYFTCAGYDGELPRAGLVEDQSGALYGTTYQGGTLDVGTVFKLTPSSSGYSESVIYNFQGYSDGAYPAAPLIVTSTGVLYGTTEQGGACSFCGTAFELTPSGSSYKKSTIYEFTGQNGDGEYVDAGLTEGRDGTLYGTTANGGPGKCGIVFALTATGSKYAETVLYGFQGTGDGGTDGCNSTASLLLAKSGVLFGTTTGGGASGNGTAFELTPSGSTYAETVLHSFQGGSDGEYPTAALAFGEHGALYSTTENGGSGCSVCGTVFELAPAGSQYVENVVYSFQRMPDGLSPQAPVIVDKSRNKIFGTTFSGGQDGGGVAFEIQLK